MIKMGEIGFEKILLILLIVLLLFGARRIPELAGSMGKGIREFKKNLSSDPSRDELPQQRAEQERIAPPAQGSVREPAPAEPKRLMN